MNYDYEGLETELRDLVRAITLNAPEIDEVEKFLSAGEYGLEPDPKVVEQYQYLVIQPSLSRRWRKRWDGLVLLGASIAVRDCDIQAI